MLTTVTLLVSQNPHLIRTVQRAHDDHDCLRLEVCGRIEKAVTRLHPGVVMVLVHLTSDADREVFHELVREAVTRTPATIAIVCSDEDAAREARAMIPEGGTTQLCLVGDVRRLIGSLRAGFGAQPGHGHRAQVLRAAAQDVTILLTGETGTGKTVLARQIHDASPRRGLPFLVVDCGALSASLIESEIFGHVRGAFTGADKDRIGKFAAAGEGTLVLDEINSVPLALQAKLLRVIEDRVFERLGDNRSRRIEARMIVVSNVPLDQEVARERFRADLFHRLNVIEFRLKPLRERSAEVIPLALKFLADHQGAQARGIVGIARDAVEALESYPWPGNVRELRNVIERVVALGDGPSIRLADLPDAIRAYSAVGHALAGLSYVPLPAGSVLDNGHDDETVRICEALRKHGNNRVRAARELRISRVTLYKKLRKYGLMANGQAVE